MRRLSTSFGQFLLLSAGLLLAVVPAYAQEEEPTTRSREVGRPPDKEEAFEIGRFVYVGIGVDGYEHPNLWTPLDNAVNDVDSIRAMLTENFGFEAPPELQLTNDEATRNNILATLDELYELRPEDNVVFFFAGHGISAPRQVGDRVDSVAYIVPVDAKDPPTSARATRQYIQIEDLLEQLAELPVRHVLAVFDACESGVALSERNGLKTRGTNTNFSDPETLMRRTSRHVLTSATGRQKALDVNPDFPGNSMFTGWLLEGLRRAAEGGTATEFSPDVDGNGALTVSELARFVIDTVTVRSGQVMNQPDYQTPDHGTFQLDQRGELVIELAVDPFMEYYRLAEEFYNEAKFEQFAEAVGQALGARSEGPRPVYLRYLQATLDGDPGAELAALQELSALAANGEDIPMEPGPLALTLRRAEARCKRGGCEVGGG